MNAYPYLRLQVHATPLDPPPGDLAPQRLRRVIGKALVDTHCPFGAPLCQEKAPGAPRAAAEERCDQARSCPYGVLFARSQTQRVPFALYVPPAGAFDATVELTLYGDAWRLYSWALAALRRALATGVGKERRRWRIERVFTLDGHGERRRIAGRGLDSLPVNLMPEHLDLEMTTTTRRPVEVELLSPTRLVRDGRLLPRGENVAFDLLVARIVDRFRELYGDEELRASANVDELLAAAQAVPVVADATRWVEVHDYSARMGRELRLGGLTGRLRYGPEASAFWPLLRVGEVLHLGKNPASGCGRIHVAWAA